MMFDRLPTFCLADIVTAYDDETIGSKVIDRGHFESFVQQALMEHDTTKDKVPGQHFVQLPVEACATVSAGVGPSSENPSHYVVRRHRKRVHAYLRREFAAKAESVAVVIYTIDAVLKDPDCTPEEAERMERCRTAGFTHCLVAVLAAAGPPPRLSPYRFTHNLAGGNREALVWTADEIRAKARDIVEFDNDWSTVAD